jgi:hypothetical protein
MLGECPNICRQAFEPMAPRLTGRGRPIRCFASVVVATRLSAASGVVHHICAEL